MGHHGRGAGSLARLERPQQGAFRQVNVNHHVTQAGKEFLLLDELLPVLLVGHAGDEENELLGVCQQRLSDEEWSAPGLSSSGGRSSSSRVTLVIAATSGKRPRCARRRRRPGMSRRLISLVPSKMRLMRESRQRGPRVFLREAVAAVGLQRLIGHVVQDLAAPDLGDGALERELVQAAAAGGGARSIVSLVSSTASIIADGAETALSPAKIRAAMSASFCWMRPNELMGLPNCWRSSV